MNAANARWGSLYDALYGTDALDAPLPAGSRYNAERGAKVIAYARKFLDDVAALTHGKHEDATKYSIESDKLVVTLKDGSRAALAVPATLEG